MVVIALMAPVSTACMRALLSFGRAIARMIRMIAITISSSMREKPAIRRYLRFSTHTPPAHCMTNVQCGTCKQSFRVYFRTGLRSRFAAGVLMDDQRLIRKVRVVPRLPKGGRAGVDRIAEVVRRKAVLVAGLLA